MKKVLVFNGYYYPAKKYGGPTTSLASIVENCSDEYQFYIIAANHDLGERNIFEGIHDGWNDVGKAKVAYLDTKRLRMNYSELSRIIKGLEPHLVWLVGILLPYTKWPIAAICRNNGIPCILSPRGEVCENAFHIKFFVKIIISKLAQLFHVYKNVFFHATSDDEIAGLKKYFGVKEDKIFLAPNIPASLYAVDRCIEKKSGAIRMVFISRIQEKKNILEAIRAANKLKDDVIFDIYGPLESKEYWQKCENEIQKSPANVKISYCGLLTPNMVAETFKDYHCLVFPTVSENYGHAIVESLSVSCPVLLSYGTTPWDDLNNKAGYTYELNNTDALERCMKTIIDMDQTAYDSLMKSTNTYFNQRMIKDNAVGLHKQMIKKVMSGRMA